MPVVFRSNGMRFHFFSNEGGPREPLHIHVQRADCLAKIWLHPGIAIADNYGFSAGELRVILEQVALHATDIERVWNEYFG